MAGDEEAQHLHDGVGVDVHAAELEFAELQREFTQHSRHEKAHLENKYNEKLSSDSENTVVEEFDLEEYLRGPDEEAWGRTNGKKKRIGVLWDNLSVFGQGGVKTIVPTFTDSFKDFVSPVLNLLPKRKSEIKEVEILKQFRGLLKPGEMCLVLGRPGSGCTTFLKVIANQRFGYTGIKGDVQYGRFDAASFEKRYRGEAVYNQEDDVHHPTLTVGQTLDFALDVKTAGKLPEGITRAEAKRRIIKLLLKMFNIEHTENTIVGNAQIRGVSGGERKRVSIAEMMVTKATVNSWDNATRGLDSSTALDFAKSLRIMTNLYQTTTFVSLYQASENIYSQFDKVLVIDSGRQVYFGPTSEARAYFEGLGFAPKPRQTTPDYLTGCTDVFERDFAEGRDASNVPSTPDQLEEAFRKSSHWERLGNEIEEYRRAIEAEEEAHEEFLKAVKEDKKKQSRKSVYTVPYYYQVWALCKRQFRLRLQDVLVLIVGWFSTLTIACLMGSMYLRQPETTRGAFNRGGVIFISVLFNAFNAFAELGATMMGRPIVNRHRAYAFHRPSALYVAQIMVDLLFSSAQIFAYCLILYFMVGLNETAGDFFTFFLFIVCAYLSMALFFRTAACMSPDFDAAIKPVGVIITVFVVTCGYLIAPQEQQKWLSWIFWINGLGLSFGSLMANEFRHLELKCGPDSLIPTGPGYNDIDYQSCAVPGAKPGSDVVSGTDYVKLSYNYDPAHIWRNFGILISVIIVTLLANMAAAEYFQFGKGGKTVTFFAKETPELKRLNEELRVKKEELQRKRTYEGKKDSAEDAEELSIESKSVLTWENLKYTVPTPGGPKVLLKDVFGYVKPGQLTALMGASGAGKTTLLDVLAARKSIGVIEGDILVDGLKPKTSFQRSTAYAEQLDVHEPTQTVREALRFSAYLRQPENVPIEQKNAYVEKVIELLEMESIADAIIGDPNSGLAVEERKRVTIGVELAAKPELLLFLDEPTSGLDSQSAYNIVRFLKKLAMAGQAILCTIHQPNASLFEYFDRLLLLQRGGEVVYFGETGEDAQTMLGYFRARGADCPPDANPAEFMLDAIGAGSTPRVGNRDWADLWRESKEFAEVKKEIQQLKESRLAEGGSSMTDDTTEYATSKWHQIVLVVKRTSLAFWRSPNYGFTRLFNHIGLGLPTGLAFLTLDNSFVSMQQRVMVLFQTTVLPALILSQVEPRYDFSRFIFRRENSSKMYGRAALVSGLVLAEMPYSILCSVVFWIVIYLPPKLSLESSRAGYQFFMILIVEIFSVTLGQALAALTPSAFIATLLNPLILVIMGIFSGVTITKADLPGYWQWLHELNPAKRQMSGMMATELRGLAVQCKPSELARFPYPPEFSSCMDYVGDYLKNMGGYIVDVAEEGMCAFCRVRSGDEVLASFGLQDAWDNRWRDLGIVICYIAANIIIISLAARFLSYTKR